jgi:hypothetical protein
LAYTRPCTIQLQKAEHLSVVSISKSNPIAALHVIHT